MVYSNFRDYVEITKKCEFSTYHATVDVTTGFLFWKKTVARKITKNPILWFFDDTGEWVENDQQLYSLERAYLVKQNK